MVHNLIHEIPVVRYDHQTSRKIQKEVFKHVEGYNVEVVGRFVQDQEVGVLDQYRTQVQSFFLTTTQLFHIIVLLFAIEKEPLQQLPCRNLPPLFQGDVIPKFPNYLNYFLALFDCHTILGIIAKAHGFSNHHFAGIGGKTSRNDVKKGRFSGAVFTDDAHAFPP